MNSVLVGATYAFLGLLLLLLTIACFAGFAYAFWLLYDIIAYLGRKIYARCVYNFVVKRWPSVRYDEEESGKQCGKASSCAICLEKFNDGELCRQLPACSHLFHIHCVDLWLKEKLTCPICRTAITNKAQVNDENV
ncbi:hypothetical protein KFK09_022122 [Dendrobium nobile]|uniref:RING-type domain-containing protein n=1 Tax=Dendrobium nobile TaxID=94219 RepID=A0A8T3AHS3_DENNO|nr:hypothetical protein KFK09_022122 [Dendrobium nobile]